MKIVRQLDECLWREFVDNHPQGNIFHTPEMAQVFAQAKGYRPDLWATVDENGFPLALLLPVQVTLVQGMLRQLTTRAIAYGSVLCSPGPGKQALSMLLRAYQQDARKAALFTELRNLSDLGDLQSVLQDNGFAYEDHLNYLVDLDRPSEVIMQGLGKRTRHMLRRALRQGQVVVEDVDRPEQAAICYDLLRKTYAKAHVPLADPSLFKAVYQVLNPRGMVKFLLARVGDQYAAAAVELIYKDVIYGWYGGMDRAFSRHIPNEQLLWYIFKWGAEHGYRVYDFGGAGKPDEKYGVRDFKAHFGGKLVCFGRNTWVHSPVLLRASERAYTFYRKFARF